MQKCIYGKHMWPVHIPLCYDAMIGYCIWKYQMKRLCYTLQKMRLIIILLTLIQQLLYMLTNNKPDTFYSESYTQLDRMSEDFFFLKLTREWLTLRQGYFCLVIWAKKCLLQKKIKDSHLLRPHSSFIFIPQLHPALFTHCLPRTAPYK